MGQVWMDTHEIGMTSMTLVLLLLEPAIACARARLDYSDGESVRYSKLISHLCLRQCDSHVALILVSRD